MIGAGTTIVPPVTVNVNGDIGSLLFIVTVADLSPPLFGLYVIEQVVLSLGAIVEPVG